LVTVKNASHFGLLYGIITVAVWNGYSVKNATCGAVVVVFFGKNEADHDAGLLGRRHCGMFVFGSKERNAV
jgi:hypothetical protein